MASRYTGSRYDGDSRRSRSRDRSPDRRSLYSDGGPRRSSAESRSNAAAFQTNRDSFRDTLPRDTPRGPKALLDPPSGPRGGGYSGDFRGRGRGRGRGWRDDSRDRGRDRDIDFRDRRDAPYRDDRSRERERPDWRDRDRDSFRGRRPSPRPRSPLGRDFRDSRDARDGPLGVDADRARRGSRDGPLSAGSSSSDPPFVHSSYRGDSSYRGGYGRGRGRGRGDWDRSRGRPFYDDRDRYGGPFRSRSQEGRFRDRDDRDRESNRYLDADLRPRDLRDDRDARDRETRLKIDRTSHEPPTSTKDVSPPPVAPAAPSFGSVPNRTALTSEVGSATGKAPPTGPRALKEDRPGVANAPPVLDTRAPPTGPSKPPFERSPPIPSGPRSQRPGPSSKQWINPNLKHRVPESPKLGRSSSFAQSRPTGLRADGTQSDQQGDTLQRPRSSDAKADGQLARVESNTQEMRTMDLGEASRIERRPRSAGSSIERDKRQDETSSVKVGAEAIEETGGVGLVEKATTGPTESPEPMVKRRPTLKVPAIYVSMPEKHIKQPILDQSSDSDDEEIGDMIESGMIEVEKELKQLEAVEDSVSMDAIVRYALISLEAVNQVAIEPEGLEAMVGPIPDAAEVSEKPTAEPDSKAAEQPEIGDKSPVRDDVKPPAEEDGDRSAIAEPSGPSHDIHMQPTSIEQEVDAPAAQKTPAADEQPENEDRDMAMEDAVADNAIPEVQPPRVLGPPAFQGESVLPSFEEAQIDSRNASKRESSTPSPPEDEDETDIEDVDLHSIAIVREHMQTPPLDSLPYFDEKPWDKDRAFLKSMNTLQPDVSAFILKRLEDDAWSQHVMETQLKKDYAANYDNYIRFTMSDEPVAVKSREKFSCVLGATDLGQTKPALNPEPKPEHTRRSRYASERDLERVLEESRKIEDEKRERQLQAEREKHRTDKEAVIPRQYQTDKERENEFYSSDTGFVRPEKIVATWEVLPPIDNFAEDESGTFEKAYLEFPKQWGRVSEPLAHRDFGTAIQFYYLKKEKDELNLKEKLKKQPKKRKRGGRGKTRSSALVSELGNGDNDNEETQETGENGERRRPRRAAAPTFNSEATPATDGESGTPAGTPGRRGAAAARADGAPEKPKRGRRAKDKDQKAPRVAVTLAAAPTPGPTPSPATKGNRSRSASRVQSLDWMNQQTQEDIPRLPSQYELAPNLGQSAPGIPIQSYSQPQPLVSPERGGPPSSMSEVMAPPPLRPEPPPQPSVAVLDIGQPTPPDRKSGGQPSSYWSVPEAAEFPSLLKSFGSDWAAIAAHMRTKTAVMVKNYYTRRKDSTDWEAIVKEADDRKTRGEKRPPPPVLTTNAKKRYDTSSNRPLAAADTVMEDVPAPKIEHPPTPQTFNSRFNVPIAAQPQPPQVVPSPFTQATQAPPLVPAHLIPQVGSQPLSQPTTQTMSPVSRPLRAPLPFPDREREREQFTQQTTRTPLVSKPPHPATSSVSESPVRHPLPGSLVDPQTERQKPEPKPPKEPARQPERPQMRVKQEPDLAPHEFYGGPPTVIRAPPSRVESMPLSARPVEAPRNSTQAPQAPYAVLQHQSGRGFMSESTPSSPGPSRSMLTLTRPSSRAGGAEPYNVPPVQRTPPSVAPAPPRAPKTSNLMALLNDDPPAPPKRVVEVPAAPKVSSTPPPHASLSRPPPPPPPPSHVRRDSSIAEAQPYGYSRGPPAPPSSSMPSLKPYTASPQAQPLSAPRQMPLEGAVERDYYGGRPRAFTSTAASSPQNSPHYQVPPAQPPQVQYSSQTSYPYGAPIQPQPPNASSPPPQYAPHQPVSRSHEPSSAGRETGWPSQNTGHPIQHQHQHQQHQQQQQHQHQHQHQHQQPQQQQQPPPQQQQPAWSSHPPQPPKSTQPQPTQSAWAAQHASAPKPPQPSSSVPPQSSWVNTPPPPRGHDPMALRDNFPLSRMQTPLQVAYPPSSRPPEPPPPQGPVGYARYPNAPTSAPVPGRDPRDAGPPRSYTPVSYDSRGYPPQAQDLRDSHLREQQQQQPTVLQQQLRPQDRHIYDRPPPDRYGR